MFDTTQYEARDENGKVTSRVNVHVVTEDDFADLDRNQPLNVSTVGGVQSVKVGDVLVQAPNPNFWDVVNADEFNANYADPDAAPADQPAPADAPADESTDGPRSVDAPDLTKSGE